MRKILLMLIAFTAPAMAKPPAPAIAHIAKICTPDGAFGRSFGASQYGQVDAIADDEWAPFRRLVIATDRSGAPQISAEASFHDAGESYEDDVALARRFLRALDKAITAKHRFPHRETGGRGVTFHTSNEPDGGLVFDLHQESDRVIAACIDLGG